MIVKFLKQALNLVFILSQSLVLIMLYLFGVIVAILVFEFYPGLFNQVNVLELIGYAVLMGFVPILLFNGLSLLVLVIFDVILTHFPSQTIHTSLKMEVIQARITRAFMEKNTYYTDLSLYVLPLERNIITFIHKTLNLDFPVIIFSKEPFLAIRMVEKKDKTIISLYGDNELHALTLSKFVENVLEKEGYEKN